MSEDQSDMPINTEEQAVAYLYSGYALQCQGRAEEALKAHEVALQYDPALPQAHLSRGVLLFYRLGQREEGIEEFREAVRLMPDFDSARHSLALALATAGHYEEAIAEYQETLRRAPDFSACWRGLGQVYLQMGQTELAILAFRKPIVQAPSYVEVKLDLAKVLVEQGDTDESLRLSRAAVASCPNHPACHLLLGNVLAVRGELIAARAEWKQVLVCVAALDDEDWDITPGDEELRMAQEAQQRLDGEQVTEK